MVEAQNSVCDDHHPIPYSGLTATARQEILYPEHSSPSPGTPKHCHLNLPTLCLANRRRTFTASTPNTYAGRESFLRAIPLYVLHCFRVSHSVQSASRRIWIADVPFPFRGTDVPAIIRFSMPITPEDRARQNIDKLLDAGGWKLQDRRAANITAGRGVAVREFPMKKGHGEADYLLFADGAAIGAIEAKREGTALTEVEIQTAKYSEGVPDAVPAPRRPLPFLYQSTGVETRFTSLLEPDARSRPVFAFHRPETLAQWLEDELKRPGSALRAKLRHMPPVIEEGLRPAQVRAIRNLEVSLAQQRPRALIQMASGGGKTYTACNTSYRLIKYAGARRILFLVDRSNLGRQTLKEFQAFITPEENRPFTELYNVQHMQFNKLDDVSKVCITTIQRLYSMLKGEEQLDPALEEESAFTMAALQAQPAAVEYNPRLPIETFDFIITDECHRSIYNLWRQVLEYFDAFLIGLTATPSKQTLGFFNQNLVMEYNHEQAVADRVNVDFDLYRIRTLISEHGSTINAGFQIDKRDRQTRKVRW